MPNYEFEGARRRCSPPFDCLYAIDGTGAFYRTFYGHGGHFARKKHFDYLNAGIEGSGQFSAPRRGKGYRELVLASVGASVEDVGNGWRRFSSSRRLDRLERRSSG